MREGDFGYVSDILKLMCHDVTSTKGVWHVTPPCALSVKSSYEIM